jgi:uncharacterized protein (DUF427 family)
MVKAIWNGAILAESDQGIVIEGNYYFPGDSVNRAFLQPSETHTTCGWKGVASYYDVVVNGKTNLDAAWYYPVPKEAAQQIAGHIGFWHGVQVIKEQAG